MRCIYVMHIQSCHPCTWLISCSLCKHVHMHRCMTTSNCPPLISTNVVQARTEASIINSLCPCLHANAVGLSSHSICAAILFEHVGERLGVGVVHPRVQTKWRRKSNATTVDRLPSTSSFPSTCWCSCPCRTSYYQRRRSRRKTVGIKAPCVFGASTLAILSCWYLSSTWIETRSVEVELYLIISRFLLFCIHRTEWLAGWFGRLNSC